MEEPENKIRKVLYNEVSFVIAVVGVVIGVFIFFADPNKSNQVALVLQDARITSQQKIVDELTRTQQNDIKEVKNEIAGFRSEVQNLTNSIIRLQTIIEERIPNPKK